jgi:threonine dehydrogenase-like Zn-dependent dehydrogenase
VPERLDMAQRHGVDTIDRHAVDSAPEAIRELTDGRGVDSAIDAVGLEAETGLAGEILQQTKLVPDRFGGLVAAARSLKRGGTLSISGVYGGQLDPVPLMQLFDKGIQIRMGQAHVRRWTDEILPLLQDGDPLGVDDLTTHKLPLEQAPSAYEMFQKKEDGAIKVVLKP